MLKRFGLKTLGLAAILAMAVPTLSVAAERGDHGRGDRGFEVHGRDYDHHEVYHVDRDHRGGFGIGIYAAPAPAPAGYYDQFGVWHPYGYYDQFGVYHAY
jgi:hypothetical protein